MKLPTFFHIFLLLGLSNLRGLCEDVLLHRGPTVSTSISSSPTLDRNAEELVFVKEFHVDSSLLAKLPSTHLPPAAVPVSAERAIELAKKTVELGDSPRGFTVEKLELLTTKAGDSKTVEYYLIEMLVNGSSETRVVLMDGSVIRPQLKRAGNGKR